jgi:hypothetical protein
VSGIRFETIVSSAVALPCEQTSVFPSRGPDISVNPAIFNKLGFLFPLVLASPFFTHRPMKFVGTI